MSWRNRSADGTVTVYSDSYIHSGHRRNSSRRRHRTSRRPRNDEEEVGYVCSVWRSFTDGVSPARGRRVLALWVRGRPTARRNDSGEIIGWYGLVEDIDARKRAAGAARRAEEPPSVE